MRQVKFSSFLNSPRVPGFIKQKTFPSILARTEKEKLVSCWIWTSSFSKDGDLPVYWHPDFKKYLKTRRIIYNCFNKALNNTQKILMSCRNRSCVNPNHFIIAPTGQKLKKLWD